MHSPPGTIPALPETALPFPRLPLWRCLPVPHQNSLKLSFNGAKGSANEGHTSPERLAGDGCSSAAVTFDKEEESAPHASGTAKPRLAVNLLWAGLAGEDTGREAHHCCLAGLAMPWQQPACPCCHRLGAQHGVALGGSATISCFSSSQPVDPGPPVLPPCWAGTRANTSFIMG